MDVMAFFRKILSWALGFLPDSPFQALDTSPVAPYLSVLNWIVPVSFILSVMETWLVAIAAYYIISAALRWIRAIS
ncbi:conserved protein of unknown function [Ruminococcaceae bacterium BL-6]|nr:conserved protein of unknown function [Ruminococcaceae bacterium BL-6]